MHHWQTKLAHQLEELHLVRCSLFTDERFAFVLPPEDLAVWITLLDDFTDADGDDRVREGVIASLARPPCQARFEVRVVGVRTWFEVAMPECTTTDSDAASGVTVSVRGECVQRDAHERWNAEIRAQTREVDEIDTCAFPAYELLTRLVAMLRPSQDLSAVHSEGSSSSSVSVGATSSPLYDPARAPVPSYPHPHHALLTSHHLVSPTKRRTLNRLSSQLDISGFAKVGYPGIIYAEGPREGVEAFVREVKGMQWLALRVRFVERVSDEHLRSSSSSGPGEGSEVGPARDQTVRWAEVSKVGEVLAWMRARGREGLVTDLGIGASSRG